MTPASGKISIHSAKKTLFSLTWQARYHHDSLRSTWGDISRNHRLGNQICEQPDHSRSSGVGRREYRRRWLLPPRLFLHSTVTGAAHTGSGFGICGNLTIDLVFPDLTTAS